MFSDWSLKKALLFAGRAFVLAAALLSLFIVRSSESFYISMIVAAFPLATLFALGARENDFRLWAIFILSFVFFAHFRALVDQWGPAPKFLYPAQWDQTIFLGISPVHWLQNHLYNPGTTGWIDVGAITVHVSYFFTPYIVAFLLWKCRRETFGTYIAAAILTFYVGALINLLVPTAPPWLAAHEGMISEVARIYSIVLGNGLPATYEYGQQIAGTNPVAAMPSLHFAVAVLVGLGSTQLHRIGRLIGGLYILAMAFTLMYLGEHYFVDLLAGIGLVLPSWWAGQKMASKLGWNATD